MLVEVPEELQSQDDYKTMILEFVAKFQVVCKLKDVLFALCRSPCCVSFLRCRTDFHPLLALRTSFLVFVFAFSVWVLCQPLCLSFMIDCMILFGP